MYNLLIRQLLLSLLLFPYAALSDRPPGKDAILLSRVRSLTLRGNRLTTSRRVSPIPQLKCTGPSKRICNMYEIDTMRCTNEGYDYDEEDVQWTCTASLPQEFKLGATDVICEGYRNADDKWVLKGSCGVQYRLLLTEAGEEKFGHLRNERSSSSNDELGPVGKVIFFGFMIAVFVFILAAFINECCGSGANRPQRRRHGGGGGGGGGGYGDDGPPPPYSASPPPYTPSSDPSERWRPGFWTGAMSGGAAGYALGRRSAGNRSSSSSTWTRPSSSRRYDDPGEGSSGSRTPQFSSSTSSTGFGSTRRR
ncbi:hypothetical protein AtubIFM55763_003904 [Aspergillus tubingensis]|uniref:Store-operated calcium entry-associated regulatory factor n=1 Tax=Aspergillus niger TaxID=5061 RepID=A0A100IGX6_ASPNG|nr:DUF1183 domain protein [Aspergillus tubingensis]GAQ41038.1 DUF1183 domain protein [Aspergillus niger]GFN12194.1 DUF1183 domain protein [Aspergillus tubingensis]GLA73005.1 hypothetical protein AtubIFM55763_003904 [Aspergillus tubingensis]GLA99929.1 hypothetical protein AtubIFM57143_008630 [Aspergillus tubingensis]GLB20095.1 hypothetical protein AtubIFM61612_010022 [Aspergillus tubingensis]